MDSMEDLVKKLGWIAWCLTVIGWFLTPIISLLVNKIFDNLVFDTSTKLKDLERQTIPKLKQTLRVLEDQIVLGAAEGKVSQSDMKILHSFMEDLKSALYETGDILDDINYRRIEKGLHPGDDDKVWVETQLAAASAWISSCKESWFGRWININRAAVMKGAQSVTRFVIQGWRHSRQKFFCICGAMKIAGAAVLQCVQSWYQQLGKLFRCLILRRSGPAPPPPRLDQIVVEETQAEEKQGGEGEMPKEIEEGCEGGQEREEEIEAEGTEGEQVGETSSEEEILNYHYTEGEQVGETSSEEEIEEDDEEGKKGETTSSSILWYCARSVLTWFAKACFIRDWSYGIVGIKSDKKDASAIECLVRITERISLKKRINHIEGTLNTSKGSDLLKSGSGTTKDNDKESSSEWKEIANMHRNIKHKVFGREEHRAEIINMLRDGPGADVASSSTRKHYSVIGICGITGSGKSTLAQYVCDYEKRAGHFNLIMFILVGKTFSIRDIFREMLDQIMKQQASNTEYPKIMKTELKDLESLKEELEKELEGKRFLLVLDDLWVHDDNMKECEEREILLGVLNAGQIGSRILVTAQKKDAAAALGAQEQIPIPDLEEGQYLSMFMHYSLGVSQVTSNDYGRYEQIGRKITKKLCGSPIAARIVAARLKNNNSIDFWETTANLDVLNQTMGALLWSYQQLGDDIRRCFAYCNTFPKGYRLKRDELVRLWIAQGFVSTRNNAKEELEDIGQSYFDQLLTFSFLTQGKVFSLKGDTEEFTVHDLLHELAEKVSGSDFFRIGVNGSPEDIPRRVHHLFVETKNVAEINEKILDLGNLRTLIINVDSSDSNSKFTTVIRNHDLERLLERLFMRLKKLRVLIIKVNFEKFSVPASIDHIKHLRYLAFLPSVYHLILPSTFSKLYHIQTIDIPCYQASCPEDMANLVHLRHTSAPLCFPNIGRLTSLQTLKRFEVKEEQGYELNQLKHLNKLRGKLSIEGLGNVKRKEEAIEANLVQKEGLRKLELEFSWGNGPDVEAEVLEGLCPPMHLKKLSIKYYRGSRYPRWMLSRQQSEAAPKHLQKLELYACSQLAYIPEDSELFIGLRELSIEFCDWDRLPQNMERLVSLQKLKIWDCAKMKLLPTLTHQSLEEIGIMYCGVLSETCKEEGHENWRKIQHIPYKFIV